MAIFPKTKKENYTYGQTYASIDGYVNKEVIFADRIFIITDIEPIGNSRRKHYKVHVSDDKEPYELIGDREIHSFSNSIQLFSEEQWENTKASVTYVKQTISKYIGAKSIWGVNLLFIEKFELNRGYFEIFDAHGNRVIKKTMMEAIRFAKDLHPYRNEPIKKGKIEIMSDDDYERMKIKEERDRIRNSGHFKVINQLPAPEDPKPKKKSKYKKQMISDSEAINTKEVEEQKLHIFTEQTT